MKQLQKLRFSFLVILTLFSLYCHKANLDNPLDPSSSPIGTLISILPSTSISISDFNPKSGLAGTEVIIIGRSFSTDISKNSVKFNETIATVTSATDGSISVKVPDGGSVTGKISVSSNGQTVTTQEDFIVPPQVTGFTPTAGAVGVTVTITGTNFSDVTTKNTVKFNGVSASILSSTNTQIQTTVPSTASEGYISIDTNGFSALSSTKFQTNISGNFYYTSNMNSARYAHTVTLLNNGKVLIAGGRTKTLVYSEAELYDPDTGIFTKVSDMNAVRYSHTATVLNDGTVLIAGGYGTSNALQTAEIYNPNSGTFSTTGNLTVTRAEHTATMLANGKVLLAGGTRLSSGSFVYLNSAETYDSSTRLFSATAGAMVSARANHSATKLNNGKVLIAGGACSSACLLNTAQLYDSTLDNFNNTTGNLNSTGIALHTATLLNSGLVLIAIGGTGSSSVKTELFNSTTGFFSITGNMKNFVRTTHTATLLSNGKVIIIGGGSASTNLYIESELYDPTSATFTTSGNLNTARNSPSSVLLNNGRVLVTGGKDATGNILLSAEIYTP